MYRFARLILSIGLGAVFLLSAGHATTRARNLPATPISALTTTVTTKGAAPAQDLQGSNNEDSGSDTLPSIVGNAILTIETVNIAAAESGQSGHVAAATCNDGAAAGSSTSYNPPDEASPDCTVIHAQADVLVQGTIYTDANDNGHFDLGEGVDGATIALNRLAQPISIATLVFPLTTLTAPDGSFRFDNVPFGEYVLLVTLSAESQPVHSQTVIVVPETVTSLDPIAVIPGTQATASVRGTVYVDGNGNGQLDAGEGVDGAAVALSRLAQPISIATLVFPLTTLTAPDGSFRFDDVPLGSTCC